MSATALVKIPRYVVVVPTRVAVIEGTVRPPEPLTVNWTVGVSVWSANVTVAARYVGAPTVVTVELSVGRLSVTTGAAVAVTVMAVRFETTVLPVSSVAVMKSWKVPAVVPLKLKNATPFGGLAWAAPETKPFTKSCIEVMVPSLSIAWPAI